MATPTTRDTQETSVSEPIFGVSEDEDYVLTAAWQPRTLPYGWKQVGPNLYKNWKDRLSLIVSGAREQDGKRWIHVSLASPDRLPTWAELKWVKDWIIGPSRTAIQVLPKADEYVNRHPNCLHLWACLDGDPVPDFRRGGEV